MQKQSQGKYFSAKTFQFNKVPDTMSLAPLKIEWRKSLTAPQDDMWESFIDNADHWEIHFNQQTIGYACINSENRLLQFFVIPEWMHEGTLAFQQFIHQLKIEEAIIGTNNPLCLSTAMHFQKSIQIEGYLFSDFLPARVNEKEGTISLANITTLEKLVDFSHNSTGGSKEWLHGYISNLINQGELFVFENDGEILGTFEVRKSESNPNVANIGMIVSPLHRKQGLGTFLLGKAKETALAWGRQPICGCDKNNTGSLKCIHNNGFRSVHQMLLLKLSVNGGKQVTRATIAEARVFESWQDYQEALKRAIAPLTEEQLQRRLLPGLRTPGEIAEHIVFGRALHLYRTLGEAAAELTPLHRWDDADDLPRTAVEIIHGLNLTWRFITDCLLSGSPTDDLTEEEAEIVQTIWGLLDHDLPHAGELSLLLGAAGLPGVEI